MNWFSHGFVINFRYVLVVLFFHFKITCFVAQTTKKDSTQIELIEVEVLAPSKSENDIGTTLNYKEITKEYLTRNQGNTFINTLEKLPGISSINVGVGISKPVIRGLSLNRVIVNEYGIKQEGQQWGADHGLEIDQFNVDKVEVVKGPVSVLYGSDGIGGVINIYPSNIPKKNSINGDVLLNYKSNNDLYGTSIKLQGNKNDVYTIARFTHQDYGSYRVPANQFTYNGFILPIYNNRLKNTAGKETNFSILTGIKRKWGGSRLYLSNYCQQAGFFVGAFGVPRAYQLFDDGMPRKIDIPNQFINHFKIISNTLVLVKKGYLELDFGYQYNVRNEYSFPHAHGVDNNSFGNLAMGLDLQTYSANLKFNHRLNSRLKNIYGISVQHQINSRTGHEFLIPDYEATMFGAFVFSEYKFNSNFLISGGLRIDAAKQTSTRVMMPTYNSSLQYIKDVQAAPALNRKYFSPSGSIGASYHFNTLWKLKTNVGSAFRIPVIAELAANGVHHGTFRHERGDSTLLPERGYMLDLGLYFKNKNFAADFTPFVNYFDNYIYLSPSAKFSPLPDAGQIYLYKETEALFYGFESSLAWQINKWILNEASIEYVWNKNLNNQLPLPFTPPLSILDEISLKPFKSKQLKELNFSLTGQYFAPQYRVDRNEPETEDYFLVNLSLSNTFLIKKTQFSIYLQLRNATNANYFNNMSRYRILNLPEQGRNIQVMLKYGF
jgi:iron complex outermembrane recepter protein